MIALITATWDEIGLLQKNIDVSENGSNEELSFLVGELYGQSIVAAETGVGIRRARAGTSFIIQKFKPSHLISAGYGGALSSELKVGDIIVGTEVFSLRKDESQELKHDFKLLDSDFKMGGILTESRFINKSEEKQQLFKESNALVVDMETWAVVEATRQSKTPVISVRAVSDESSDNLPDMAAIYNKNGELDFEKADSYFKENPDLISPYLKFRFKSMPIASNAISSFLKQLFQSVSFN